MSGPGDDELLVRMRDANEKLVLATLRAEALAEEAEQARQIAAENEERFRSLVLASSAIVWRADANGAFLVEPDAWFAFTGLRGPARGPIDWLDAVPAEDRSRVRALWSTAAASSSVFECQHQLRRRAGGYAWVVTRAVPMCRDAVAYEWVGMMTDITERIEMEHARERFMAMLSHELRSPLAAISVSAETLQHLELEAPFDVLVTEMEKTSRRMTSLVHDLLDFARGRSGTEMPLRLQPGNLGALCTEIVAEVSRAHPDRRIALTVDGDLDGIWDLGRLAQVVTNLLTNAVSHGIDPISVTVGADARDVSFAVSNRGTAILSGAFATLFEPFARAGEANASRGLGLGLYIAREILRAHHGTIAATSTDEQTTFHCRIPRDGSVQQNAACAHALRDEHAR